MKQIIMPLFALLILTFSLMSPVSAELLDYDMSIVPPPAQNTVITPLSLSFGELESGSQDNIISGSFELTNTGNVDCLVSAGFITYESFYYGMTSTTSSAVVWGSEFEMMNTDGGAYEALTADSASTSLWSNTVVSDSAPDLWDVRISIPVDQAPETYTGTVELTFSEI